MHNRRRVERCQGHYCARRYNQASSSSCIGSIFRVWISRRKFVDLKLVDVSQLDNPVPGKEGFALLFSDSRVNRLSSALYEVEHAALGKFLLMISAVNRGGSEYEAVINRQYS